MMASRAVIMLFCMGSCAYAAKKNDPGGDLMSELRRAPRPTPDAKGKFLTFTKHFVRSNPETSEFTQLSYNSTRPVDHFVDVDSEIFAVKNIACTPTSLTIETSTVEGHSALHDALLQSPTGLILTGARWGCRSVKTGEITPAFRSFWAPAWNTTTRHAIELGTAPMVLETVESSPFDFVGEGRISFFTNHTEAMQGMRRRSAANRAYVPVDLVNFNYDRDRDGPIKPSIPILEAGNSKVSCEDCYLYLGGGVGVEVRKFAVKYPGKLNTVLDSWSRALGQQDGMRWTFAIACA
jgi:hypothetical protein